MGNLDLEERGMDCCFFAFSISSQNYVICGKISSNEHSQTSFAESLGCFCSLDIILTKFIRKSYVDSPR